VAVCGGCPGWYFFYEGIMDDQDDSGENKIVMEYVNGILQPVMKQTNSKGVGEKKI
jgi:hypothetical protein